MLPTCSKQVKMNVFLAKISLTKVDLASNVDVVSYPLTNDDCG